jgi:hypothetical protein
VADLEFAETELVGLPLADVADLGALWGLYFAIYYGGIDLLNALPRSVQDAYNRAQKVLNG